VKEIKIKFCPKNKNKIFKYYKKYNFSYGKCSDREMYLYFNKTENHFWRWEKILIKRNGLWRWLSGKIEKFLWKLKIDIKLLIFNKIYYPFYYRPFGRFI
jgi:hypothetical protein